MPSDVDLLRLEIETIWTVDDRGRLLRSAGFEAFRAPLFAIAGAADGLTARAGCELPDALAAELEAAVAADAPPARLGAPPLCIAACAARLRDAHEAVHVTCGPSFLVVASESAGRTAAVRTWKDGPADDLRAAAPAEAQWDPVEWRMLLAGELGPWAMAFEGDRVIATCFCARLTERAAEAGVWTAAAYRGRGHARAVTAAWAALFEPGARVLFYSTSERNHASQAIARRLGFRELGWLWQFRRAVPRPR